MLRSMRQTIARIQHIAEAREVADNWTNVVSAKVATRLLGLTAEIHGEPMATYKSSFSSRFMILPLLLRGSGSLRKLNVSGTL